MESLRKFIRFLLEDEKAKGKTEDLLTEPDEIEEREEGNEASSGGVAGVATPLGTGPTYPVSRKPSKKLRSPKEVAASSFGGNKHSKK